MTTQQLHLVPDEGLPEVFIVRWRELAGPPVTAELCRRINDKWTLLLRVNGHVYAFLHRESLLQVADELFKRIKQ